MSSVPFGVNIVRTTRWFLLTLFLLAMVAGCSKQGNTGSGSAKSDREQIQDDLNEVVARWHAGDKGVLYENEFPYVKARFNFDEYLKFPEMKLDADTVDAMNVQDAKFFGRDSALVQVEVVFKGPTGKISRRVDSYHMYHQAERWIRPTLGAVTEQRQWDSLRAAADSAADAEAKELNGK
jgi:hypothetical protein